MLVNIIAITLQGILSLFCVCQHLYVVLLISLLLFRYTSDLSNTPIWLDNLNFCYSETSDLRQCTYAVGINDCSHSEDIILTCKTGWYILFLGMKIGCSAYCHF